jgi:hypothetical protein
VHQALTALPEDGQRRLGVVVDWKTGSHTLTYRQTERTFGLVARALGTHGPDGLPSPALQAACDDLLQASVPGQFKEASTSLAVDWTDLESFSRPPPARGGDCADPEAAWGHRKNNLLRSQDELFYGYYLSAGIMMPGENGPAIPESARRATVSSCRHDPARAPVPVLTAMPAAGIPLGDVLAGSGYAHRDADAWALPLRQAGAQLVQDLHPHDRGPKGTHEGAIIANGNLYCPNTPRPTGTPGKPKTRGEPPPGSPPKPANGAARRSPPSSLPHGRPSPGKHAHLATAAARAPAAPRNHTQTAAACRKPPPARQQATRRTRTAHNTAAAAPAQHAYHNVRPKRENKPR